MSALSTRKLRIHWPHRHVTDERVAALRAALLAFPGDDDVLVDLQSSVVVLQGFKVDASSRDLHRRVRCACQRQVRCIVIDDDMLWP